MQKRSGRLNCLNATFVANFPTLSPRHALPLALSTAARFVPINMTLPILSPKERYARQEAKRQTLLAFLASGECWTDLGNAARLWHLSSDATATTLRAMARDRLIVRENIAAGVKARIAIYGVTPDGIACCHNASANAVEFQQGRLQPTNIEHHLAVQRVRIIAEAAGWRAWQPGRLLYGNGLRVVPDALGIDTDNQIVAIELERNVKSLKRRREVLSAHILTMARKTHWQRVVYICDARCDATRLRDLYMSLDQLDTPSGRAPMTDAHRARFAFINLDDFAG